MSNKHEEDDGHDCIITYDKTHEYHPINIKKHHYKYGMIVWIIVDVFVVFLAAIYFFQRIEIPYYKPLPFMKFNKTMNDDPVSFIDLMTIMPAQNTILLKKEYACTDPYKMVILINNNNIGMWKL